MTAQFPLPLPPCWLPPSLPLEERAGERRPFNILPQPATLSPCGLRFACCAAQCQSAGDAERAIEAPNADGGVRSNLGAQPNRIKPPPIILTRSCCRRSSRKSRECRTARRCRRLVRCRPQSREHRRRPRRRRYGRHPAALPPAVQ